MCVYVFVYIFTSPPCLNVYCSSSPFIQVLRHEEFHEGCAATCNGPYDGKWSKTIMGYGSEADHFVLELTYNYGVKEYKLGNEFNSIVIRSKNLFRNIMNKKGVKKESFDDCCGKGELRKIKGLLDSLKQSI